MKLNRRQLRELIQEVSNEEIILDPFEKIVDYNIAHENKTNLKSYSLSVAGSVAGAILMETLVVFARYVAPEVIDYIKSQLIDRGVEYAYKVFAYKIFEMLLNDDSFTADGLSPLRLFPSIDPLRLNKESLFFLKGMSPEELRNFKMHVSREIMKTDEHPFKVDVDSIFSRMYLVSESKIRQMIREAMGPIPFDPGKFYDKPGIADNVDKVYKNAEVIEFRPSDIPENLKSAYDKVIDLAQQLQRASIDTKGSIADKLSYPIQNVDNNLWSDFGTDLGQKMAMQDMPFSDQRRELQEDAIESAAEMIDSVMSANERPDPESKSIDLFMASEDADKLLRALSFLELY